jgi:hypothetical protein
LAKSRRTDDEAVGIGVYVNDPIALAEEIAHESGIKLIPLESLRPADAATARITHIVFVLPCPSLSSLVIKDQPPTTSSSM